MRNQKLRLESYINSCRIAAKLGLDIVVLEDSNIDTNPKVDYSLNYNHKTLFEMWADCLSDLRWTIHNTEFTRYAPHQKPSIIEHILSNCSNKLSQVKTTKNSISDHYYLFNCRLQFQRKPDQTQIQMGQKIPKLNKTKSDIRS